MDKMRMESLDITAQNVERIGALFPNCITETIGADGKPRKAINFDMLRQMLSADVVEGDEAYEFTWVGKKAAIVEANKPIHKTLRPCMEESIDWDTTENLYIEGDNLEVLKLLQESYLGKVKMIYIDPPYNTGHDFIYNDSFVMDADAYTEQTGLYNDDGNRNYKENPTSNPRFHSDWCSMIYSRLLLARNLLATDGVMAISIGYQEITNLMNICKELFTDKQVMSVTVQTSGGKPNGGFSITHEHIVFIVPENYEPIPTEEDMKEYSSPYHGMNLATFNQIQRPNQAYPIYVDSNGILVGCGKSLQERVDEGLYSGELANFVFNYDEAPEGCHSVWPVTSKNEQCVWRLIPSRLLSDWKKGYIKIVPQTGTNGRNKFAVQYLSGGIITKIEAGELKTYKVSNNPAIPTIDVEGYKTAGFGISTIWTDKAYYTTQGSNQIKELFDQKTFSYPKPLDLLEYILKRTTSGNDLVLDFFSGSATTAHALMNLNASDSGRRKYIMIQLPEECESHNEAYKAGYKNICQIGRDRIRRAGVKIRNESSLNQNAVDFGFRAFKLDESNMTDVFYSADEYSQDLLSTMESNVKSDRSDLDLLFGCLLEWGLPLSLPYHSETIEGCTVHTYNEGDLMACFNTNVPDSVVKEIAERKPLRAVFRDSSFQNSPSKINVNEIFKLLAPDTRVKVI